MRTFTDQELAGLVSCTKKVEEKPAQAMRTDKKMRRNEMTLLSQEGQHRFSVFLRQSTEFPEDFSVGMDYLPNEEPGRFITLRCNGQHGGTLAHPHHAYFHIHRTLAADINAGIKDARQIEITTAYASFDEALFHFCRLVGLTDADIETCFPGLAQRRLFPDTP